MYGDSDITSSVNKPTSNDTNSNSTSILWEYTTNENSTEILHHPFINTEQKLGKDKVQYHYVSTEQFYSIKRIDFDLYLDYNHCL